MNNSGGTLPVGRNCSWTCLSWFECCGTGDRNTGTRTVGAQGYCGSVWWSWPYANTWTERSPRWMEVHTRWSFPPSPTDYSLLCHSKSLQAIMCLCRISWGTVWARGTDVPSWAWPPCCGSTLGRQRSVVPGNWSNWWFVSPKLMGEWVPRWFLKSTMSSLVLLTFSVRLGYLISASVSSSLLIRLITVVSSANLMIWLPPCMAEQSCVNSEYSCGLRHQPCGAPVLRTRVDEVLLPIITTWGLPVRKSMGVLGVNKSKSYKITSIASEGNKHNMQGHAWHVFEVYSANSIYILYIYCIYCIYIDSYIVYIYIYNYIKGRTLLSKASQACFTCEEGPDPADVVQSNSTKSG